MIDDKLVHPTAATTDAAGERGTEPISTYMLELTDEELADLWALLAFLDAQGKLDELEQGYLAKCTRLMEGR